MIKPAALIGLFLFVLASANAQSTSEYLKLRKQNGIKAPMTADQVADLVGSKTIELKCTVKGTFRVGDQDTLLVERSDGESLIIDANKLPDWAQGGEVAVRALVRINRPTSDAQMKATLLALAPESEVAGHDTKISPAKARAEMTRNIPSDVNRGKNPRLASYYTTVPASEVTPIYASFVKKWNPRLTFAEANQIATCVIGFSMRHPNLDARLIMAVCMAESDFNPNCTSHAGAKGVGQLMPSDLEELGLNNAYDNVQNIYGTVTQISKKMELYRKRASSEYELLALTLAGYNAGDGAVRKYGGVPPYRETQNYVRRVIGYYEQLRGMQVSRS